MDNFCAVIKRRSRLEKVLIEKESRVVEKKWKEGKKNEKKMRKKKKHEKRATWKSGDPFWRMKAFSPRFGVQLIIFCGNADPGNRSFSISWKLLSDFNFRGKVFATVAPSTFAFYTAR